MSDEIQPGEIPDWLLQMRPQEEGFGDRPGPQQEQEEEDVEGFLDSLVDETEAFEPVEGEPPAESPDQEDFLGGLREQMAQDDDLYDEYAEESSPLVRAFATMQPWQRFVLALLLFFNVALLGCMALAVLGRFSPSF